MFLSPVEIVIESKCAHMAINELLSNLPLSTIISKVKIKDPLGFLTLPLIIKELKHGNESLHNILESVDE